MHACPVAAAAFEVPYTRRENAPTHAYEGNSETLPASDNNEVGTMCMIMVARGWESRTLDNDKVACDLCSVLEQ